MEYETVGKMSKKLRIGGMMVKFSESLGQNLWGLSVISDKLLTNSKSAPHKNAIIV